MAGAGSEAGDAVSPRPAAGRRRRQPSRRPHRVEFSLTDEEFAALCAAAGQARLARGAYAARVAVGAALGRQDRGGQLLHEALAELVRCGGWTCNGTGTHVKPVRGVSGCSPGRGR